MKNSDILKDFKEYLESLQDEEFFEVFEKEFGAVFKEVSQIDRISKNKNKSFMNYKIMKTMKNEKSGADSFAENMREKLGLKNPLPKEVMDDLRESVINLGKKTGDTDAEDVLTNCLIELERLKDDQSKAIIITYLLGTLPMDLQKLVAEHQQEVVIGIATKNLVNEGPETMLSMLLMGTMLDDKDSDE